MRVIKFRAWDTFHDRMYYQPDLQIREGFLHEDGGFKAMQFTGLQDKNGKEIYEGDILRWNSWEQEGTEFPDTYIVSYRAPSFVWDCYRGSQKLDTNGEALRDTNEYEVVGNIYENPELMSA